MTPPNEVLRRDERLPDAVRRAAPKACLYELAADWTPELAALLVRTGAIPGELVAEAVAGLREPQSMFAALAAETPHIDAEALFRVAHEIRGPMARARSLGALLAAAPWRYEEVLAAAAPFDGSDRVFALVEAFPHLQAEVQASLLDGLAPGFRQAGFAAKRVARAVRPDAFRVAWNAFTRSLPDDVTVAAILAAAAPSTERDALRASLVARVWRDGDLDYSAIRELLPTSTGANRAALLDRAFKYRGWYAAAAIKSALGSALADRDVEARFVAFLDAGRQDYPWDLACAYANIAARRTPIREHCLSRATALLDRMLDLDVASENPYPVIAEAGRIATAMEHQLNALLEVTVALDGESRCRREQQVLAWIARIGPEHSCDDLVPIAWDRAAVLSPLLHGALLDVVATIREDAAAFRALGEIVTADRSLESPARQIVMARISRHAYPGVASAVASLRTAAVDARPYAVTPRIDDARVVVRRTATPEEVAEALAKSGDARIDAVSALARVASAAALPTIDDPFVEAVASFVLLDEPTPGVVARLDALLARNPRRWESYCRAARALTPSLEASERLKAMRTLLNMRISVFPLPDVSALFIGLDAAAWPAVAKLIEGTRDEALPAAVVAAAIANAPASSVLDLVRAVLLSSRAAAARHMSTLCEAVRAHGLAAHVRGDLADFVVGHCWSSMTEMASAIESCSILVTDPDDREAIATALVEESTPARVLAAAR